MSELPSELAVAAVERIQPKPALPDAPRSRESRRSRSAQRTPPSSASSRRRGGTLAVCAQLPSEFKTGNSQMPSTSAATTDATAAAPASNAPLITTTKGWTLDGLLALGPRMKPVPRISAYRNSTLLASSIRDSEISGTPLIIDGWHNTPCWPRNGMFSIDWLLQHGDEMITVRNCVSRIDKNLPLREFIAKSRAAPEFASEGEAERLYGKDAVCPPQWREWLMESGLPEMLKPGGPEDVLELLSESERVETLMCYHGVGDTFTAAHKDLCASSGHNLLCDAERDGSAFWFMTRSSDAPRAAAFLQERGAELDHETRVVSPEELARAPFTVYVAEQRVGDLVLVPRRSCHQVVNRGGLTTKLSWSRMTIDGLSTAFHHELPVYRRVCRPETYRIKLLVYRALLKFTEDLRKVQQAIIADTSGRSANALPSINDCASSRISFVTPQSSPLSSQSLLSSPASSHKSLSTSSKTETRVVLSDEHLELVNVVRKLLLVFDKILKEEHHGTMQCELRLSRAPDAQTSVGPFPALDGFPSISAPAHAHQEGLTCDFCGADIFLSFFECRRCGTADLPADPSVDPCVVPGSGPSSGSSVPDVDSIVVCPGCYVEGRACLCSVMTPMQRYPMDTLLRAQNEATGLLNFEGYDKKGRNDVVKAVALSHQAIHNVVDHPGIFAAACQLLSARIAGFSKKSDRKCQTQGSHLVPAAGALHCRKCHASRCFRHILSSGFHVADALTWYAKDDTHAVWHGKHTGSSTREKRQQLKDAQAAARCAEESGAACNMRVSLILHAQTYSACLPLSRKVMPGWYDDSLFLEYEMSSSVEGFTGSILGEDDDDDTDSINIMSCSRATSAEPVQKATLRTSNISRPTACTRRKLREVFVLIPPLTAQERAKYRLIAPKPQPVAPTREPAGTAPVSFNGALASLYGPDSRAPSVALSYLREESLASETPASRPAGSAKQPRREALAFLSASNPALASDLEQATAAAAASAEVFNRGRRRRRDELSEEDGEPSAKSSSDGDDDGHIRPGRGPGVLLKRLHAAQPPTKQPKHSAALKDLKFRKDERKMDAQHSAASGPGSGSEMFAPPEMSADALVSSSSPSALFLSPQPVLSPRHETTGTSSSAQIAPEHPPTTASTTPSRPSAAACPPAVSSTSEDLPGSLRHFESSSGPRYRTSKFGNMTIPAPHPSLSADTIDMRDDSVNYFNYLLNELKETKDDLKQTREREQRLLQKVDDATSVNNSLKERIHQLELYNAALMAQQSSGVLIQGATINANVGSLKQMQAARTAFQSENFTNFRSSGRRFAPGAQTPSRAPDVQQGWRTRDDRQAVGRYPPWREREFRYDHGHAPGPPVVAEQRPGDTPPLPPLQQQQQQRKRMRRWDQHPEDVVYERAQAAAAAAAKAAAPGSHAERGYEGERPKTVTRISAKEYAARRRGGGAAERETPAQPQQQQQFTPSLLSRALAVDTGTGGTDEFGRALRTPGGPPADHRPAGSPSPSSSVSGASASASASSLSGGRTLGLGLGLEMDARTYNASTAATRDPTLTDNPWEGSELRTPF